MDPHYYAYKLYTEHTYTLYIENNNNKKTSQKISIDLYNSLICFLSFINEQANPEFINRLISKKAQLIEINKLILTELKTFVSPSRISDLNSAVIGVPNDSESDIDITISVKDIYEQEKIHDILLYLGYKLKEIYEETIPSKIDWHTYTKYIDSVEIEIKVRDKVVVDIILIAHKGIASLDEQQKLKISFIKSTLVKGDKKIYKKFKYILYSACFKGDPNSIIFKL